MAASCEVRHATVAVATLSPETMPKAHTTHVNLSAASVYIPGVQAIVASVLAALVSVVATWAVPLRAISPVRTIILALGCIAICMARALKVTTADNGEAIVFCCMQPCPLMHLAALVVAQLNSTCLELSNGYEQAFVRLLVHHSAMLALLIVGFLRAASHRAANDTRLVVIAAVALAASAIVPPPSSTGGPLCMSPSLATAAERVTRAFVFAFTYTINVYAAVPQSPDFYDASVCVVCSGSASAWTLGAHPWLLLLAMPQAALAVYSSVAKVPSPSVYERVSTTGAGSDSDAGVAASNHEDTDVESGARVHGRHARATGRVCSGGLDFTLVAGKLA